MVDDIKTSMSKPDTCDCSPSVPFLDMQTREWSCQACGMALPTRSRPDPNSVQTESPANAVPPPPPDDESATVPPPPDKEGKYGKKKSISESAKSSRAVEMATAPNRRIAVAFVLLVCVLMSGTALLWSLKEVETSDATGKRGEEGNEGENGLTTLLLVISEPAGENCSNGGHAVMTGLDDDRDGVLDIDEVLKTTFICNGTDAQSSTIGQPLTDLIPVASGNLTCESGGLEIRVGIDDDGDGNLSVDETDATDFICNGVAGSDGDDGVDGDDGESQEMLMSQDSRATVCANGLRMRFGSDDGAGTARADDLILQADEVHSLMVLCWVDSWNHRFAESITGVADSFSSACEQRIDYEDWFIFTAITPSNGCEPFISDGTAEGTSILKDINLAGESLPGYSAGFTVWQGLLWFDADDGINGRELWYSDGTSEGTKMAADICPGNCDSNPSNLYGYGESIWFSADDGINGSELWSLDSENKMPTLRADICTGICSSEPGANGWAELNGDLFLTANDGGGTEVWTYSDSLRMVSDFGEGIDAGAGQVTGLVVFEGRVWFDADDQQSGREMWHSDGNDVSMLDDMSGDSSSSLFNDDFGAHVVNGKLLLRSGISGTLTAISGNASSNLNTSVLNIGAGSDSPVLDENGNLWFSCQSSSNGMELCISDGEVAGIIWEFMPGNGNGNVRSLASMGGYVYVVAEGMNASKTTGHELWRLSSSTAAELIFEGQDGDAADGQVGLYGGLTTVANTLFFSFDDGIRGHELMQIGFLPSGPEYAHMNQP